MGDRDPGSRVNIVAGIGACAGGGAGGVEVAVEKETAPIRQQILRPFRFSRAGTI